MELFTPSFGLIFWMFVVVVLLLLLLGKFAWPVIVSTIEQRADLIDKGVEYAENAKSQLDNAKAEAAKQQAEILREADRIKTQIIEEAREAASKEAKKVIDAAQVSIEQSRKEAELQFRNEVSAFSLKVAEKILRGSLESDKAQHDLVNKLIDEVEVKN